MARKETAQQHLKSDAQVIQHTQNTLKRGTAEDVKSLAYKRDKDRELVRGVFRFHEIPGGVMEFVYKGHKGDPVEKFTMEDGGVYTIPLGVARHLNNNCWYPVHDYAKDEHGKTLAVVGKKVRRCSFSSLDFMDADNISNSNVDIVTVSLNTSAQEFINKL